MSPDEVLQLSRLKRFLHPMLPIAVAFDATYLVGALVLKSTALWGAAAAVLNYVICLVLAIRWTKKDKVLGPALLAGYSLLATVAAVAPFIPFAFASLCLIPITVATLVVSYARGRSLQVFLAVTLVVELVVLLFGVFLPPFFAPPPPWLQHLINAAAVLVAAALALILIWADSVRLRRAIFARDEFLAMAAHELRTPLTATLLTLDGVSRRNAAGQASSEWVLRQAQNASKSVRRLTQLVDALLDVSRIDAGRLELFREDIDLAEVARETVERIAGSSPNTIVVDASVPVRGSWDRVKLEQVLTNLISNAVKYGEEKPVEVRVHEREGLAVLEVRDEGIGISPESQAQLFQRFQRGGSVRHYGGLGLGLWITRTLVEAHGGTIRVASAPSEGSRFTVELPRQGET